MKTISFSTITKRNLQEQCIFLLTLPTENDEERIFNVSFQKRFFSWKTIHDKTLKGISTISQKIAKLTVCKFDFCKFDRFDFFFHG